MPGFYVSPTGTPDADGLSEANPWPFAKLTDFRPEPGDVIRLRAGDVFPGWIDWGWRGIGDPERPILLDRYGPAGAPNPMIVSPDDAPGLAYAGPGGVHVGAVTFRGRCVASSTVDGLSFGGTDGPVRNVRLFGTEITGYTRSGVYVNGAENVALDGVRLHHCGKGTYLHTVDKLALRRCVSWENDWLWPFPHDGGNAGNGFAVYDSTNVTAEYCTASDNGRRTLMPCGAAGHFFQNCQGVEARFLQALGNGDKSGQDGQGVIFLGCQDSVMDHCYAEGNLNAGFSLHGDPQMKDHRHGQPVRRCTILDSVAVDNVCNLALAGSVLDCLIVGSTFADGRIKAFDVAEFLPTDRRSVSLWGNTFRAIRTGALLLEAVPGLEGILGLRTCVWDAPEPHYYTSRGRTFEKISDALDAEPIGVL